MPKPGWELENLASVLNSMFLAQWDRYVVHQGQLCQKKVKYGGIFKFKERTVYEPVSLAEAKNLLVPTVLRYRHLVKEAEAVCRSFGWNSTVVVSIQDG